LGAQEPVYWEDTALAGAGNVVQSIRERAGVPPGASFTPPREQTDTPVVYLYARTLKIWAATNEQGSGWELAPAPTEEGEDLLGAQEPVYWEDTALAGAGNVVQSIRERAGVPPGASFTPTREQTETLVVDLYARSLKAADDARVLGQLKVGLTPWAYAQVLQKKVPFLHINATEFAAVAHAVFTADALEGAPISRLYREKVLGGTPQDDAPPKSEPDNPSWWQKVTGLGSEGDQELPGETLVGPTTPTPPVTPTAPVSMSLEEFHAQGAPPQEGLVEFRPSHRPSLSLGSVGPRGSSMARVAEGAPLTPEAVMSEAKERLEQAWRRGEGLPSSPGHLGR